MKCPRCGAEMNIDSHRKYNVPMCYNCGYMEGRDVGDAPNGFTNFARLKAMNYNEFVVYMCNGLGIDEEELSSWLCEVSK